MSLVDSNKADTAGDMLHALHKSLVVQSLRGAIYQAEFTSADLLVDDLQLNPSLGRVDAVSRNATTLQHINLVFHQCNKRRDNNSDPRLARCPETVSSIDLGKGNRWYL